jgi:hypothetical protein
MRLKIWGNNLLFTISDVHTVGNHVALVRNLVIDALARNRYVNTKHSIEEAHQPHLYEFHTMEVIRTKSLEL